MGFANNDGTSDRNSENNNKRLGKLVELLNTTMPESPLMLPDCPKEAFKDKLTAAKVLKQPKQKTADHLHTYRKVGHKPTGKMFQCIDPDCTHTQRRDLLLGKRAKCPHCADTYVIDSRKLQYALPHCGNHVYGRTVKPPIVTSDDLALKLMSRIQSTLDEKG